MHGIYGSFESDKPRKRVIKSYFYLYIDGTNRGEKSSNFEDLKNKAARIIANKYDIAITGYGEDLILEWTVLLKNKNEPVLYSAMGVDAKIAVVRREEWE